MVYMQNEHSVALVQWAASFKTAVFINYEQVTHVHVIIFVAGGLVCMASQIDWC